MAGHTTRPVVLAHIQGHRVWATTKRWYAEDELGEILLGLVPDHYDRREGATPPSHSPVVRKYYNLVDEYGKEFVVDYVAVDYIAPTP